MATPAASAWHRRRNLLSTPASAIATGQAGPALSRAGNTSATLGSGPPPRRSNQPQLRAPLYHRSGRDEPISQGGMSVLQAFKHFRDALHLSAEAAWFKALGATSLSAILAYFTANFIGFLLAATPLPSTAYMYRRVDHYFPTFLLIFKTCSFAMHVMALFTMHSLLSQVIAKQVRAWPGHPCNRPAFEGAFFRLRLLHAAGCVSGCVVQSVLLGYITYGPSVLPLPLNSQDAALSLRSFAHRLTPTSSDLMLCCLIAVFAGLFFSICWTWSESYTMHSYPFTLSPSKRWALLFPKLLILAGFPVVCSASPALIVHWLLYRTAIITFSEESFWASSLRMVSNLVGVSACTFLSLFSWNLLGAQENDYLTRDSAFPATTTGAHGTTDVVSWNRDKILLLSQQCTSDKRVDDITPDIVQEALQSLSLLCQTEEGLKEYPGFLDASGDVWRFSLRICLSPIHTLEELLANCNAKQFQSSSVENQKRPLLVPSRTSISAMLLSTLGTLGTKRRVLFLDADVCIRSCEVISKLVTASYELDSFGVVHRTLPQLVGNLLLCKQQTEAFLFHQDPSSKLRSDEYAIPNVAGFDLRHICRKLMLFRSEYETVVAIDDALTLAIYRIVGSFRNHMYSYIEGMEVTWDRSLDRQLASFLDYQLS